VSEAPQKLCARVSAQALQLVLSPSHDFVYVPYKLLPVAGPAGYYQCIIHDYDSLIVGPFVPVIKALWCRGQAAVSLIIVQLKVFQVVFNAWPRL